MKRFLITFIIFVLAFSFLITPKINVFAVADGLSEIDTEIVDIEQYNNIDICSNNIILTSNDMITKIGAEIVNYNNNDIESGINLPNISVITKNIIAVFDSLNRVQIYSVNFEYIKTYRYVDADVRYNLGQIVDVTKDYAGNLYFVDATNCKILSLKTTENNILEIDITTDIIIDNNTKLCVNANGNLLAVESQNQVYVYDILQNELIASFNASADDLYFDYLNNLFVLSDNTISKYSNNDYYFIETKALDVIIKSAVLNIETGTFYVLSDKLYTFYADNFAGNASFENAPVDVATTEILTSELEFATANKNTVLYSTCVSFASADDIEQNQLVIILKKDIEQNNNMYYCLTNINGIQKQGYIAKDDLIILNAENQNKTYKTICKNVELKTYPTSDAGVYNIILAENTELVVLGNAHNFVDSAGKSYFAVQTENGIAYIEQQYLTNMQNFESTSLNIEPKDSQQTKFIAFIIASISLLVVTIFACVIVIKKKPK